MERKNTMLLTVIAVATLLVAVVGATFAYYSVVNGTDSSTTNVNTSTEKIGTVTLQNLIPSLYLNVTATQMAQDNAGDDFYAVAGNDATATASATSVTHDIAKIKSENGETDTVYYCSFDVTVTTTNGQGKSSAEGSAWDSLEDEDAGLVLTVGTVTGATIDIKDNGTSILGTEIPLNSVKTAKPYSGTAQYTGNKENLIKAQAIFHNLDEEQKDVADLGIVTSVVIDNLNCDTKPLS